MSNETDKLKNSKRRHKDEVAVNKQVKIAKQHGNTVIKQPHRLAKHHAMDCGNPHCGICGNPRHIHKELTTQEKRIFQDLEKITDKHSNGIFPKDDTNLET